VKKGCRFTLPSRRFLVELQGKCHKLAGVKDMKYKQVSVSKELTIPVPDNLSPEDEANYIANQIAFVDLEQLATDMRDALNLWKEGKMIPMEDVVDELSRDVEENGPTT
jgi:hypothetical protein